MFFIFRKNNESVQGNMTTRLSMKLNALIAVEMSVTSARSKLGEQKQHPYFFNSASVSEIIAE